MKTLRWLAIAGLPWLIAAAPEKVPNFDVGKTCGSRGGAEQQARAACKRDELGAKAKLAKSWRTIPANVRQNCLGEGSIGGAPSYVELLTCAQMEDWSKEAAQAPDSKAGGAAAGRGGRTQR